MNINNILLAFRQLHNDGSSHWVGLKWFKEIFSYGTGSQAEELWIAFKNNIKMFFLTWFIGMPLQILFGYYLFKKRFGHGLVRIVYMLPSMVSGIVMSLLFLSFTEEAIPQLMQKLFHKQVPNLIRSNDTAFGVQVFYTLWLGFTTSIIIYSNAMFALDGSIFESGQIDGTTTWTELIYLVIPMITPTLSTYIITGFSGIFTISGSLFIFYDYSAPKSAMLMGYWLFKQGMVGDLSSSSLSAAVSLLLTLITLPLTMIVRWIMDRIDPMRDEKMSRKMKKFKGVGVK